MALVLDEDVRRPQRRLDDAGPVAGHEQVEVGVVGDEAGATSAGSTPTGGAARRALGELAQRPSPAPPGRRGCPTPWCGEATVTQVAATSSSPPSCTA